VTVATVLVLSAACVGTLGSRMLGRATWPGRAPLLAIVTYLAATDAVRRIQRLLGPAEPLGRVRRQLLRTGAGALALLALTPAVVALALGRVPVA
jgi:hypothetical protein